MKEVRDACSRHATITRYPHDSRISFRFTQTTRLADLPLDVTRACILPRLSLRDRLRMGLTCKTHLNVCGVHGPVIPIGAAGLNLVYGLTDEQSEVFRVCIKEALRAKHWLQTPRNWTETPLEQISVDAESEGFHISEPALWDNGHPPPEDFADDILLTSKVDGYAFSTRWNMPNYEDPKVCGLELAYEDSRRGFEVIMGADVNWEGTGVEVDYIEYDDEVCPEPEADPELSWHGRVCKTVVECLM